MHVTADGEWVGADKCGKEYQLLRSDLLGAAGTVIFLNVDIQDQHL